MSTLTNGHFAPRYPKVARNRPTCVDLFCGAGGLTLGFVQAGGIPLAAIDNDLDSVATYRGAFPKCKEVRLGDITDWVPSVGRGEVDVVIGGPPCQGFSLARGLRFVDDPRNSLYKEFVRIVGALKPAWFVMENVQGIMNIGGGVVLKQIREDFDRIKYWMDCRVINMAEFGVPQTRKRAVFVGSRVADRFDWPEPMYLPLRMYESCEDGGKSPYLSVLAALGDLGWPMGRYLAHRANSQMRGPRNREVASEPAFTLRVRGDELALCEFPARSAFAPGSVPETELVYRPAANEFQRLMREDPPPWVVDRNPAPVEDVAIQRLRGTRRLTLREQARLQTFPDWFHFAGRPYSQYKQVGNAVPPLFGKQLFAKVLGRLR